MLNLNDTLVASIEPLRSLTRLESLTVDRTLVTDLSPLGDAPDPTQCASVITARGVSLSAEGQNSIGELCARGWSVVAQLPGASEQLGCQLRCFAPLPPG